MQEVLYWKKIKLRPERVWRDRYLLVTPHSLKVVLKTWFEHYPGYWVN